MIPGPWLRIDEINQRIPILRTAREREARFYLDLGIMIEPRMWFTQEAPARAIEAVNELGQSLVRRDTTRVEADYSLLHNGGGVTEGQVQLDLAMPEKPGRSIVRLRGSIPVAIQIRTPVPALEIPLSASPGQSIRPRGRRLHGPGVPGERSGDRDFIDVRINLDRFDLPAGRDGQVVSSRLGCLSSHQVEIVDADGKVLTEIPAGSTSPDGNARMSFMVRKNWNKTRPARFRYYGWSGHSPTLRSNSVTSPCREEA